VTPAPINSIAGNGEQHMGRSRGGLTTKIHAVVDTNGLPVQLGLTPGEAHDNRLCSVLLTELRPQTILLADRGYDADWIRALVSEQGAWANIPPEAEPQRGNLLQPISLPGA
jgi:transposase